MNNSFSFPILKSSKPALVWFSVIVCLLQAAQCALFLYTHFFHVLIVFTFVINFALAISLLKLKKLTVLLSLLNLISVLAVLAYYSFLINPETSTIEYYKWAITDKTAFGALIEASLKKIFTIWLFFYSVYLSKKGYLK